MSTPVTHCCTSSLSKEITGKEKRVVKRIQLFFNIQLLLIFLVSLFVRKQKKRMTTLLKQLARNETRRDVSRL